MNSPCTVGRGRVPGRSQGAPVVLEAHLPRRGRRRGRLVAGALLALAVPAAALVLALAASGVFNARHDSWTHRVRLSHGLAVALNVPALVRLGTSPAGMRLLDGRRVPTRIGRLHFGREGATLVVRCSPCRLAHPLLAAEPIIVDDADWRLTRPAGADRIEGRLLLDGVDVRFTATLRSAGIDLDWSLDRTAIERLFRVVRSVVPEAHYARIEGVLSARGRLRMPTLATRTHFEIDGFDVGALGTERLREGAFVLACTRSDGAPANVRTGDGEPAWVALDALGTLLPAAVLAAEDQRFDTHAGFDLEEIAPLLAASNAAPAEAADARALRGASTITQQLARTLHTGADRNVARKLRELLYAVEMERTLGKRRILELYLNTVDWGPGLCGAKAAARTYFRKAPSRLTPLEAAWLAGILRQPHAAWEQQFLARSPERERATKVLMQMRDLPRRERERWARGPLAFAPARAAAHIPHTGGVSPLAQTR